MCIITGWGGQTVNLTGLRRSTLLPLLLSESSIRRAGSAWQLIGLLFWVARAKVCGQLCQVPVRWFWSAESMYWRQFLLGLSQASFVSVFINGESASCFQLFSLPTLFLGSFSPYHHWIWALNNMWVWKFVPVGSDVFGPKKKPCEMIKYSLR